MNDLFVKKRRRDPMELQLTAMIDIFSLIVIFLILGTVMGGVEVTLPADMTIPQSYSKESLESAPQVIVQDSEVTFEVLKLKVPMAVFTNPNAPELEEVRSQLKNYVASLPDTSRTSGILLNVIADQKTPYQKIFDVVRVFRESGFEALLFVTSSKGQENI